MNDYRVNEKVTCAYLYTISKYGYPPDIRQTKVHIKEMAAMGFTSIELEGIGKQNIEYLFKCKEEIVDALVQHKCVLPVLCIVLPQLSSADYTKHTEALELFELGCETARYLGATGVLDNGPLLNMAIPADAPVQRHYSEAYLLKTGFPSTFAWDDYWQTLTSTYRQACLIAAKYNLSYHLHPCEGSLITGTDSFINFSDAVNCPNLMFNLDTANQFYFRDNLALSLLRLKDKISYIHISDNSGNRVEHLVPGDGRISWDVFFSTLQKIGYKGRFAIDVGGDETGINDVEYAYNYSAQWLDEQLSLYSLK